MSNEKKNNVKPVVTIDEQPNEVSNYKFGQVEVSEEEQSKMNEEVERMKGILQEVSDSDSVVNAKLRRGMIFTLTGVHCSDPIERKDKDGNVTSTFRYVSITTNKGVRINPKFFAGIDSVMPIGVTKAEILNFVAYHKIKKTQFECTRYNPRVGKFEDGPDKYEPEYAEIALA